MITVEQLNYSVKNKTILQDINLTFNTAEFSFILGANGAGKSTLLKCLTGEHKQFSGKICAFNDHRAVDLNGKNSAVLSQQVHLPFSTAVEQVLMMGRYPHFKNIPTANDDRIVNNVVQLLGLSSFLKRDFLTLSGGEQQRVHFGRVLCQIWSEHFDEPRFLFLDEPLQALDIKYQVEFMQILDAFRQQQPVTIIGVFHHLNFVPNYADQLTLLKHGKVLASGKTAEIFTEEHLNQCFEVIGSMYQKQNKRVFDYG
jgi:iron complex transport system ATP-binding protein